MPLDAKRVQALFLDALQLDPAARAAFLDKECANDRELRRRVEALLRAHDEPDSMLDKSPGEAPNAAPDQETLERIDPFVQRFEKAWQSGTPPLIDDFLPKEGPDRLAVLKELVMVDMERRRQAGTPARAEDYLERYPELARHLPTRQQDAPIQAKTPVHDSAGERVGMVVAGRYKLLDEIGEGGMGTVWVAEQTQPVRRKVALKLIKAGMDSKTVLARFEAERQALALMDHPNIAKVLDGGTTENGRPYFVMEYVKGIPLTKYCDDARLSIAERLALFVPVCHAVQHAHQKGIIHRDLKPSNILVCLYDGVPLPKVIDFGLAKAMHQPLTEHTLHTAHGMMMGTPLYMSPEQAELNNLDVDTRTDVYSLGVILYELLTGTTPLERKRFKEAAWQEMLRLIKEEEPPRPSTRLSGSGPLPAVAAQRKLEPTKLTKLVRGDLDWIAMKALEKERGRRYETANALSRDIQRYLSDEAVEACPPSRSYRLRKFARKNRAALVTAAALLALSGVAIVALVGLAVSLFYQDELQGAKTKTEEALQQEEKAHQVAETARAAEEVQRKKADRLLYFNKMVLAEREWSANNLGNVKRLLQEAPPEQRGWEWRYLDRMSKMELDRLRHRDSVNGLAYSPNGKWLVSGARDRVIKIWHAGTHEEIKPLVGHKDMIYGVAFSPDSKLLISHGLLYNRVGSGDLKFWDTATWEEVHPLEAPPDRSWATAISPDNSYVALASGPPFLNSKGGQPNIVTIWDLKTGKKVHALAGHHQVVVGLTFSPDSQRLISCTIPPGTSGPSEMFVWETNTGKMLEALHFPASGPNQVLFSPDARQVAWIHNERAIRIADSQTWKEIHTLQGHTDLVTGVAYIPGVPAGGALLATSSRDGSVRIWDTKKGSELRTLRSDIGLLMAIAISPDGRRLAASSFQGQISIWDPHSGQDPLTMSWDWLNPNVNVDRTRVGVSPDGKKVITGGPDRTARMWDTITGQCLLVLGHDSTVTDVAFDPNGRFVATTDGKIRFWDLATGKLTRTLGAEQESIYTFAFSRDGKRLATSFLNSKAEPAARFGIKIRSTSSGDEVRTLSGHTGRVIGVGFSPDGERLISASRDDTARVWDVSTGKEVLPPLKVNETALRDDACFSPDGRWVAAPTRDGAIVWNAATGNKIYDLDGHKMTTCSVTFSPDGQRLATASDDGTVKIWDAASGQELLTLRGHHLKVKHAVFGADGDWLASIGTDCTLRIWEATPLTPEIRLRREAAGVMNRLAETAFLKDEILVRLRTDASLSEPLQQRAMAMAERHQDTALSLTVAGDLLKQKGQFTDAIAVYKKALALKPDFDMAHQNLAMVYYCNGDWNNALAALFKAAKFRELNSDPIWGDYYFWLAMTHWQLGEKTQARIDYEKGLEAMRKSLIADPRPLRDYTLERYRAEAAELLRIEPPVNPKQDAALPKK
jgi:WD40 repeat protein/serine/threonine protein kinase